MTDRVPGKEHYSADYLRGGRAFSYAHQIDCALSFNPETVLEVGAGAGVVTGALRAVNIDVTTADVQPELEPDVVASVTELPFEDDSFDVAICCQVLEHLEFEHFQTALSELRRVTRRGLVLSLPDVTKGWSLSGKLPGLPRFELKGVTPGRSYRDPAAALEKDGHHWEIGFPGYPLSRVREAIRTSGWRVSKTWRAPELTWHRFFRLEQGA